MQVQSFMIKSTNQQIFKIERLTLLQRIDSNNDVVTEPVTES